MTLTPGPSPKGRGEKKIKNFPVHLFLKGMEVDLKESFGGVMLSRLKSRVKKILLA